MIRIVSWLWRDDAYRWNHLFRYGPDHVNRWANMVRRNIAMEHELVCVTDDPEGIDPSIRIVPLWDDYREMGGCYMRLKAFAPEMREIIGDRFAWMDVDSVVLGDLTPLFRRTEDIVLWSNGLSPNPYCGSMVMMTAGSRAQVWDRFREDPDGMVRETRRRGLIGTDQAVMAVVMGPDEATWTHDDGVVSRYHALGDKLPNRARRKGRAVNLDDARVVYFHGACDPSQKNLQDSHPWIKENWK